ncbi:MAG: nucleotide sugar dehydrogenase [Hydrogenobacter sp.]
MVKYEDLLEGKEKICVVGLGYVGLPLALALSKHFKVIGYDKKSSRIKELIAGLDTTGEVSREELISSNIDFTDDEGRISEAKFIVVAVPTPVDKIKNPDLFFLKEASATVGKYLRKGSVVVYESTVYPGATEEVCVPILEKESGLKWKEDFFVGYSPERVNPGDREHTIEKVVKVVAGDTEETLDLIARVYGKVIKAGIYKAPDIRTAEAAKVIENIQRDINIALMNELSMIFNKLKLDTKEVLKAASTKWNFLRFEPGLVGGHCIPVDPYYLAYKSLQVGHVPELILAGRRINESVPFYVANQTVKQIIKAGKKVNSAKVLLMGITFKENVPDIRNSKVYDLYRELKEFGIKAYVYDPIANREEVKEEYGIELLESAETQAPYDCVILAVRHKAFLDLDLSFYASLMTKPYILIDVKGVYERAIAEKEGFIYWSL